MKLTFTHFLIFSTLISISSCSFTRHVVFPNYGLQFQNQQKVIIGIHNNGIIELSDTEKICKAFDDCKVEVIPIHQLKPNQYRSFFDLNASDSLKLSTIANNTGADYLIVGNFVTIQSHGIFNAQQLDTYSNLYQTKASKPKSEFQLLVYDLKSLENVLTINTVTEPMAYGWTSMDELTETVTYPASPFMTRTNLRKSIKKLRKLCRC